MNREDRLYSLIIILVASFCLGFTQIEVEQNSNHQITYRLNSVQLLSDKVKKDLKSGISTQVIILARLSELPNQLVQEHLFSLETRYDLWEEVFYGSFSNGLKKVFKSQEDLQKWIESPGPIEFGSTSLLKRNHSYQISTIETVNPVSAERLDAVQKWITQQKLSYRGLPSSKESLNSGTDLETSFSALFYNLWKRASSGEILSGELRLERRSDPFTLDSLKLNHFKQSEGSL